MHDFFRLLDAVISSMEWGFFFAFLVIVLILILLRIPAGLCRTCRYNVWLKAMADERHQRFFPEQMFAGHFTPAPDWAQDPAR